MATPNYSPLIDTEEPFASQLDRLWNDIQGYYQGQLDILERELQALKQEIKPLEEERKKLLDEKKALADEKGTRLLFGDVEKIEIKFRRKMPPVDPSGSEESEDEASRICFVFFCSRAVTSVHGHVYVIVLYEYFRAILYF